MGFVPAESFGNLGLKLENSPQKSERDIWKACIERNDVTDIGHIGQVDVRQSQDQINPPVENIEYHSMNRNPGKFCGNKTTDLPKLTI